MPAHVLIRRLRATEALIADFERGSAQSVSVGAVLFADSILSKLYAERDELRLALNMQ